jgi:hypothetical protein
MAGLGAQYDICHAICGEAPGSGGKRDGARVAVVSATVRCAKYIKPNLGCQTQNVLRSAGHAFLYRRLSLRY